MSGRPREFDERAVLETAMDLFWEQGYEATGIAERANRPVQELSGGERQRAALCRALVNKPRIVLADEPTGSLDEQNGALVFELLLDLVARENATLILATHDRQLAEKCGRLVLVRDGRLAHDE